MSFFPVDLTAGCFCSVLEWRSEDGDDDSNDQKAENGSGISAKVSVTCQDKRRVIELKCNLLGDGAQ